MVLQIIWFVLIAVLLMGYTLLDGLDFGVGFWSLFFKEDREKRILLNSVGPVWDGNEVWLITGGGAIFAAFPHVYATVFSGFYLALMLLLFALIFRAVSFEFRSKVESPKWRQIWDLAFGIGSVVPAILLGVALGNILRGIPLDANKNFTGNFLTLLNPYALVIGIFTLCVIATHGGIWIFIKGDVYLMNKVKKWIDKVIIAYITLFIIIFVITFIWVPARLENFKKLPFLWIVPILTLIYIICILRNIKKERYERALISSSLSILFLWIIVGIFLFPNMVPCLNNPKYNLTIMNSSSSQLTLKSMLILALIGMPIVLTYTFWIYKTFWGKVLLEDEKEAVY